MLPLIGLASFYLLCLTLALPAHLFPRDDGSNSYLVSDLPGLEDLPSDEVPLMYSGQVQVYDDKEDYMYFWKIVDKNKLPQNNKRTIFWLNGGPGCSSMDGALLESGPFRIDENEKVTYNNGSWHKLADMIYVDQPEGTGYSYTDGDYATSLNESTDVFFDFIAKYFEIFPEDLENDMYFAGESYAGQYIPYIGDKILKSNAAGTTKYNLKGLMIGNGYISPIDQGLAYLPFAVSHDLINESNPEWNKLQLMQTDCQDLFNKMVSAPNYEAYLQYENQQTCESILSYLLYAFQYNYGSGNCLNVYDYTLVSPYPSCGSEWPPELSQTTDFLREDQVMLDLHVDHKVTWSECSNTVYNKIKLEVAAIHLLPGILEQIPVMLFSGLYDIICNHIGTENLIKRMDWNGATGFSDDATSYNWKYADEDAGHYTYERNLSYVTVNNASHMVPYNKPVISRALIDIMLGDYSIDGSSLVTYPIDQSSTEQKQQTHAESTKIFNTEPTGGVAEQIANKSHKLMSVWEILLDILIVCIVFGIFFALYQYFSKRKSSNLKPGSNNIKKNVQWADEINEDDNQEDLSNQSFLSSSLNTLRGNQSSEHLTKSSEFELDSMGDSNTLDDGFIIGSDEETDKMNKSQV